MQSFDLTGKLALVTGCNKGIGKGMALGLAEAGADIIGVSGSIELEGSEIEKKYKPSAENSLLIRPICRIAIASINS